MPRRNKRHQNRLPAFIEHSARKIDRLYPIPALGGLVEYARCGIPRPAKPLVADA